MTMRSQSAVSTKFLVTTTTPRSSFFLSLVLWSLLVVPAMAFAPARTKTPRPGGTLDVAVPTTSRRRSQCCWQAKQDDYEDDERYQQALAHNRRRTDPRIFLTQRALQSFIYLLVSCRDPHTVRWLENVYEFSNLEEFHGTGGLNLTRFDTWDAILVDLLQRPNDVVIVAARRRGRGHGGWSTNNPYLEDRFVEFEIEIEPASLVTRLLSVRQQIAQEWVADLDTLVAVNELILLSYHERQNQLRAKEEEDCVPFEKEEGTSFNPDDCVGIESLTASNSASPISNPMSTVGHAFERKTSEYMNNKMMEHESKTGMPSSPQRKGNFDLLSLLATQEAVHQVLREYLAQGDKRRVSLEWLRTFYTQRVSTYFDGDGRYGRADDFLQDLLLAPPSVVTAFKKMELVDPLRIAEDIIQARSEIALHWKDIMQRQVPSDHMQLQRSILDVRMGKTPPTSKPSITQTPSVQQPISSTIAFGEFE